MLHTPALFTLRHGDYAERGFVPFLLLAYIHCVTFLAQEPSVTCDEGDRSSLLKIGFISHQCTSGSSCLPPSGRSFAGNTHTHTQTHVRAHTHTYTHMCVHTHIDVYTCTPYRGYHAYLIIDEDCYILIATEKSEVLWKPWAIRSKWSWLIHLATQATTNGC